MRVFVAADIDDAGAVGAIGRFQARAGAGVRPVIPGNLHITLQFLGGVADIEPVTGALRGVRFEPFEARLRGAGAFPESGPPRTVWVGAGGDGICRLAGEVEAALAPLGFCRDAPFVPHVTVFRVKKKAGNLRDMLAGAASADFGTQLTSRIRLRAGAPDPGSAYPLLWESGA